MFAFLFLFYFLTFVKPNTQEVAYFEMSRTDFQSPILDSLTIYNDTIFLVSTQDRDFFIYNISDLEDTPRQISKLLTSVPFVNFKVTSDNYLVGLGNNIESNIQTMEIYQIDDLTNIIHIKTLEMPQYKNQMQSLICLNTKCDAIGFVDIEAGIRFINLTSKESPEEIMQSEIMKNFNSYITLVIENEVISTFNDSGIITMNISNLKDVHIIYYIVMQLYPGAVPTSIVSHNRAIVFIICAPSNVGLRFVWLPPGDYQGVENDSFYQTIFQWPTAIEMPEGYLFNDGDGDICVYPKRTIIKIYNEFFIMTPYYIMYSLPNWIGYYFAPPIPSDTYFLKKKEKFYSILLYNTNQYYQISYFFNASTAKVPYTISNASYHIVPDYCLGPRATLIVGKEQKYLITLSSSQPCYFMLADPTTPVSPKLLNETDNITEGNNIWADAQERYFMIFGPDVNNTNISYKMWIYDYKLETKAALASVYFISGSVENYLSLTFYVYPVQFEDLIYLLPVNLGSQAIIPYLMVLNISNINDLNLEATNVESSTGIFTNAICGCNKNGEKYIFIKRESESSISVYKISNDYKILNKIGQIFVSSNFVSLVTSEDCNYLYAGGDSFLAIEILNFSQPRILSNLYINYIASLKIINDRVYVITPLIVYIFDISNHNPILVSSAAHPIPNDNSKNLVYTIDIMQTTYSNYIYKGSTTEDSNGGNDITIYEEKKRFFIYVNQNKDLTVGTPVTYRYYCLDINTNLEAKGIISSIQLTNTSANFPTFTPLPSWSSFDFNTQKITITVPKNYEYENLSLVFEMKYPFTNHPELYYEIITFSYAVSSLTYKIDPYLIVSTPSLTSVQIIISHYPNIKFIFLTFSGIFVSYSEETRVLIASGLVTAINEMFKNLRITKVTTSQNYPQTFNLTIQDYLNNDINDKNIPYNEKIFHYNNAPICSIENFQEIIDSQSFYSVPLKAFSYDLKASIFSDPDLDPLDFQIFPINNENLPQWLNFDTSNHRLYGTPLETDLGLLNISLQISDGYDYIIKNFYINISDAAPVINIPIKTQLKNKTITVGDDFALNLSLLTFKDADGPDSLKYWAYFEDMHNSRRQLTSNSNYWLKFDESLFSFYGSPSFNNSNDYGNNVTIDVIANDGVKNSSDPFIINVFPSMRINSNISNTSLLPSIVYPANKNLNINISVTSGSILILNDFIYNNSGKITYTNNKDMNKISFSSTVDILNQAFNYLVFRDIAIKNDRIIQENQKNISYDVYDDIGQTISGEIQTKQVKYIGTVPKIDRTFIQDYYLAEIGSHFQVSISKRLLSFADLPNMKLDYNFTLYNSYSIQTWIYTQETTENIQIFTGGNVDSSLEGYYKGILIITDEFQYKYEHELILQVDYSTLDKVKNYLQLISAIVGPIISFFAFSKFFYLIFNLIWKEKIQKKDIFLKINTPFKIKIPLIKEESKLASLIFSEICKDVKKENKKYFDSFCNIDIIGEAKPLIWQNNFYDNVTQFLEGNYSKKENTIVLTEGLLIRHLVEKFPHASVFLKEIELETIRTGKSDVDEWYNQFFFDDRLKNDIHLKEILEQNPPIERLQISDYVLQLGTFKSVEKHIFILGHYYNFIFERTILRLKKRKISQNQLAIIKPLILRAIIETKRGVPFNYSSKAFFFNKILKVIGIRILPYNYGDAIHMSDGSIKYFKTYEEKKETEKVQTKKGLTFKVKTIVEKKFPYRLYSPINDKSFPDWLMINLKKGFIYLHGTPYEEDAKKIYLMRLSTKHQYNIIQFRLNISDMDQLRAKARALSIRMSVDPVIQKTLKNIPINDANEEKNPLYSTKYLEMGSNRDALKYKSDESDKVADENIEVQIIKNKK